jgi:hypothetical protein
VILYDTIRAVNASDFVASATCAESDDGADTVAVDPTLPQVGGVIYYLVRAENACPKGQGSAGSDSSGMPRSVRSCP